MTFRQNDYMNGMPSSIEQRHLLEACIKSTLRHDHPDMTEHGVRALRVIHGNSGRQYMHIHKRLWGALKRLENMVCTNKATID